MLKLNVAAIREGSSFFETEASPADVDLATTEEFHASLHITYDCNKVGDEVFIKSTLSTVVDLTCDLCLEPFRTKLHETVEMILTKDHKLVEREAEDVYLLSNSTTEVDITDSVKQTLLLAIPYKKICTNDCKGLCPMCGANLNIESCSCGETKIDPRWQALRDISFENE